MTKKTTSTVFLVGCISAIGAGFILSQDGFQSKSPQESVDEFVQKSSGSIDVSGSIVDQDGISLDEVSVEVFEVNPSDMFGQLKNGRIERFDREFRIRRTGVSSIDCGFFKEGYYDKRLSFSVSDKTKNSGGGNLQKSGIVAVLIRVPESAPLDETEKILRSEAAGPISVLSIGRILNERSDQTIRTTSDDSVQTETAAPFFFLEPGIRDDGHLDRVTMETPGIVGPQTILRSGSLKFSHLDNGDGFVQADVKKGTSPVKVGFRSMTEAPVEGYRPSLEISAISGDEDIYFYFRIQGNFGKGVVTNLVPILEKGEVESVSARIKVFFNPTGSRDVSFIHY